MIPSPDQTSSSKSLSIRRSFKSSQGPRHFQNCPNTLSFILHVMGILRMIHLRAISFWRTGELDLSRFQIFYPWILSLQSWHIVSLSYLCCICDKSSNIRLIDEALNLSSPIQLASYPSVAGTFWQVDGRHSPEIASSVYKYILKDGKLDGQRAAEGLRKAIQSLRHKTCVHVRSMRKSDCLVRAYIYIG